MNNLFIFIFLFFFNISFEYDTHIFILKNWFGYSILEKKRSSFFHPVCNKDKGGQITCLTSVLLKYNIVCTRK